MENSSSHLRLNARGCGRDLTFRGVEFGDNNKKAIEVDKITKIYYKMKIKLIALRLFVTLRHFCIKKIPLFWLFRLNNFCSLILCITLKVQAGLAASNFDLFKSIPCWKARFRRYHLWYSRKNSDTNFHSLLVSGPSLVPQWLNEIWHSHCFCRIRDGFPERVFQ